MRRKSYQGWTRLWGGVLVGGTLSMAGCQDLLSAELPHLLKDDAVEAAGSARIQVYSAMALFECSYTAFGLVALGPEDVMQTLAGAAQQHSWAETPATGNCDTSPQNTTWFNPMMGGRLMISSDPTKLAVTGIGASTGVYDRINGEWSLGALGDTLSAVSAIYMAATLTHFGEFLCEGAIDQSDLLAPPNMLGMAVEWTNRALKHIENVGDFPIPFQPADAGGAWEMAVSIRSRAKWANRDFQGAADDAAAVLAANNSYTSWITRETGATRRNKIYYAATEVGYSGGLGINNWWTGSKVNPVTNQPWPDTIPHTGYLFLGIMPDGRTLSGGNIPVLWANQQRQNGQPVARDSGAVADTRVTTVYKQVQVGIQETPGRYSSEADDIPYMTWEELRLIIADNELRLGNLQAAIDQVNLIRAAKSLPQVSGAYLTSLLASADATRHMLLEERRREFFAEGGRYWSTKIQNTDLLWFPRFEGAAPGGFRYGGAVRVTMPLTEYERNPFFEQRGGLNARGSGCTDLFGDQVPHVI
ncbi:MAG: RagB/SusD family nutrient uptake outer membrane protein [Gemmatimonadota bacterium]|nr:RagB/SusD family nutrient uptake outer membrane protein [Gemmatimonadota bacterium]